MKTRRTNGFTYPAIVIALIAAGPGMVTASENPTTEGDTTPRVIELHAPNNATPSVTVWTSKRTSRSNREAKTAQPAAAKVIELHAPNSATPSVTVWTPESGAEEKIELAPLK